MADHRESISVPMASRLTVERFLEGRTVSLANSATLAESPIDILLWNFPLKSHFPMLLQLSAKLSLQLHRGRAPP